MAYGGLNPYTARVYAVGRSKIKIKGEMKMHIIITKSGPEKTWYQDSIGQTFEVIEPPTWALVGDGDNAYYVKHFENSTGQALFVWKEDCEIVLPQAPETTASPSEAADDKGLILTEEELSSYERELKNSVRAKAMYESDHILIEEIIESHRALFVANAELSFEIIMRKKYESFLSSTIRCKGTLEDNEDFEWFKQRHHEIIKSLEDAKCKTQ